MKTILILFVIACIGVIAWRSLTGGGLGYKVKGDKLYFRYVEGSSWKIKERLVPNAEPNSLKRMQRTFARDKNQVYFQGHVLPDCDPETFKILGDYFTYTHDADGVYYSQRKISEDVAHFEYLDNGYARDKQYAYRYGMVIPESHGATFELMDEKGIYARDRRFAYSLGKKMKGVEGPGFRVIEKHFTADPNGIYYCGKPLPNVSSETFEVINDRFARDHKQVYYCEKVLPDADPATFEVTGDKNRYTGKDKNFSYSYDKKINP